jgi:hypothetical protein
LNNFQKPVRETTFEKLKAAEEPEERAGEDRMGFSGPAVQSKASLGSNLEGGSGKELNENLSIKLQHMKWIIMSFTVNILLAVVLSELSSTKGFIVSFLSSIIYHAGSDVLQIWMFICHAFTIKGIDASI